MQEMKMIPRTEIERITFVVERDLTNPDAPFVIKTEKNPYLLIGHSTKFEALCVAFTKYLERLNEIENPKGVSESLEVSKSSEVTDSNGEPEVK